MKRTIFATPEDAEAAFYDAFEKTDLEAMMAVWADEEDIVCVHPGGARSAGVAQVRESWRQLFASGQALRLRLSQAQTLQGMVLAVHSVYEHASSPDRAHAYAPIIATNIYMRTANGWRMVVHHASSAPQSVEAPSKGEPKVLH
jgi:ketosteroid isomerase-like protein